MSEYITHIAVLDDTRRMIPFIKGMHPAFNEVVQKHPLPARLGSGSRGNHLFVPDFLVEFGKRWDSRKPGERMEEKLAFTIGWICHRGADVHFKAIYPQLDKNESLRPVDIRIVHDIITFNTVYKNGNEAPLQPLLLQERLEGHPAASVVDIGLVENIVAADHQQQLLGLQAASNGESSLEDWIKWFNDTFQEYYVDIPRYTEHYYQPNYEQLNRFIYDPDFYNPDDEIIRLVRDVQEKGKSSVDFAQAINKARDQSQYSHALYKCYLYLIAADALFKSEIDKDEFNQRFEL